MELAQLWRYPVKSLRGESCEHVHITDRGVAGDRRYALVDTDGKLGSHKSTRRFIPMPGLFQMSASLDDDVARITFPGGRVLSATDPCVDDALTQHVGRPVVLQTESDVSHHDSGPLHIVTTASLRWLSAQVDTVDVRRFRPNLVVEVPGEELVENAWVGMRLRCGDVELAITEPTARCLMTTLAQDDLPHEPRILRTIAQQASVCFGVYARVVVPGELRVGADVTLLPQS